MRGSPLHARSARLATALSIRGGADSLEADDGAAPTTDGIEHEQPQLAVTTEPKAAAAALAESVKGGASAAVTPTPTAIVGGRSLPQMISRALGIDVHEFPKFLAMSFMMFAIIYIFTMTRYAQLRVCRHVQVTPTNNHRLLVLQRYSKHCCSATCAHANKPDDTSAHRCLLCVTYRVAHSQGH
jgi:hypothetical protein